VTPDERHRIDDWQVAARQMIMPTIVAHHAVKDTNHWLASPKREQFFGPLGVMNIRLV
jgi:hypothetical protein